MLMLVLDGTRPGADGATSVASHRRARPANQPRFVVEKLPVPAPDIEPVWLPEPGEVGDPPVFPVVP
jgi:hypothetical protein